MFVDQFAVFFLPDWDEHNINDKLRRRIHTFLIIDKKSKYDENVAINYSDSSSHM